MPAAGVLTTQHPACLRACCRGHNARVWGETDYSGRVFNWVRKAFPDAAHNLLNGAIGAIQST